MNTPTAIAITILGLTLLLGACRGYQAMEPVVVGGSSPFAMHYSSDSEVADAMFDHLRALNSERPEMVVVGPVLLNDGVSPTQVEAWLASNNLALSGSMGVGYADAIVYVAVPTDSDDVWDAISISVSEKLPPFVVQAPPVTPESCTVVYFTVEGTVSNLLRAWTDPTIPIRAIGVYGVEGTSRTWPPILPSASLVQQ